MVVTPTRASVLPPKAAPPQFAVPTPKQGSRTPFRRPPTDDIFSRPTPKPVPPRKPTPTVAAFKRPATHAQQQEATDADDATSETSGTTATPPMAPPPKKAARKTTTPPAQPVDVQQPYTWWISRSHVLAPEDRTGWRLAWILEEFLRATDFTGVSMANVSGEGPSTRIKTVPNR